MTRGRGYGGIGVVDFADFVEVVVHIVDVDKCGGSDGIVADLLFDFIDMFLEIMRDSDIISVIGWACGGLRCYRLL